MVQHQRGRYLLCAFSFNSLQSVYTTGSGLAGDALWFSTLLLQSLVLVTLGISGSSFLGKNVLSMCLRSPQRNYLQNFGPSRPSDETQIKCCRLERCQSGCSQFNANFFHFLRSKIRFNYFNEENQTKGQPNFIAVSTEKIKTVAVKFSFEADVPMS